MMGGFILTLSVDVVRMIRQLQENGLSEEIRKKVSLHISDTIGISLAAYKGAPVALQAISGISIGAEGGVGRVIGKQRRYPPAYAAFSNTALAHALDFDDINDLARIHPTPVILAAALAAADIQDSRDTDLITAVALGNELVCRLGYAIEPRGTGTDSNWFLSQLFGYFGAAVAAGLVLRLDDSKLVHALGLAYMQLAGGKEPGVGVGSQARSIYPAFASMGGVQAALLAKEGVTAPYSSLDGKKGFFQIYFGKSLSDYQRNILLHLKKWAFLDTSIKLFPSCRFSHPYIQSSLILRNELSFDQIEKIVIGVNETAGVLCQPLEERCHPQTLQDAKFSIPFMVAFTFVHGSVNVNNLTEDALNDSRVLDLAKCVKIERTTQPDVVGLPLGDIKVSTAQNQYHHVERLHSSVTIDEVKNKFMECCCLANIVKPQLLWDSLQNHLDYDIVDKLPILS